MRIFNNFDTEFKEEEYKKSVSEYGEENVLIIQRNIFYFLIRGILPLILYFVFLIGVLVLVYIFIKNATISYVIFGILFVFTLFVFTKIFNVYLDYKYDFSIFTPKKIFTYKQKGIFSSDYKDLPSAKIRSIVAGRTGILGNIFGYGKVNIYTDGGMSGDIGSRSQAGRTKLTYVSSPNIVREQIWKICVPEKK